MVVIPTSNNPVEQEAINRARGIHARLEDLKYAKSELGKSELIERLNALEQEYIEIKDMPKFRKYVVQVRKAF